MSLVVLPSRVAPPADLSAALQALRLDLRGCRSCRLADHRTRVVVARPVEVPPDLLVLGQNPGGEEDARGDADDLGSPFVGPAGQLLTRMLGSVGIDRRDVVVDNLVKCLSPADRAPLRDEAWTCALRGLLPQVTLLDPRVVLLLGTPATEAVLGLPVTAARGSWRVLGDRVVGATLHPAALLYDRRREPGTPAWRVWGDLRALAAGLRALPSREEAWDAEAAAARFVAPDLRACYKG